MLKTKCFQVLLKGVKQDRYSKVFMKMIGNLSLCNLVKQVFGEVDPQRPFTQCSQIITCWLNPLGDEVWVFKQFTFVWRLVECRKVDTK